MVLYTEHVREPGRALSNFVLNPCTIPVTSNCLWGRRSDGQQLATINKQKQTKQSVYQYISQLMVNGGRGDSGQINVL